MNKPPPTDSTVDFAANAADADDAAAEDAAAAQSVLEGHVSVLAALEARSRPVEQILLRKLGRNARRSQRYTATQIERAASEGGVPFAHVDGATIDERASGQSHGGVIALVGPRRVVSLDALLAQAADSDARTPFVAMLDGIEDPFNFGQAVRALYAAGVDGLVVRPRSWLSAAGTVARASAGASERAVIAVAETVDEAADFFQARGLAVACTAREEAQSLQAANLAQPLFLVLGGERRGITRSFLRRADLRLAIPYGRDFAQSLGTVAATAVVAFEVQRQREAASTHMEQN